MKRRGCAAAGVFAVLAWLTLSGCAGFVSGSVATASAEDGRIEVESRGASASIGPSGPAAGTSGSSTTICVGPGGSTFAC